MDKRNDSIARDDNDENKRTRVNEEEDIRDSPRDDERLQPDSSVLDLPDVTDIPGQENIVAPPLGEMADTTISSDDEEGRGILDDDDGKDEKEG